jgi:hypothetical protein
LPGYETAINAAEELQELSELSHSEKRDPQKFAVAVERLQYLLCGIAQLGKRPIPGCG